MGSGFPFVISWYRRFSEGIADPSDGCRIHCDRDGTGASRYYRNSRIARSSVTVTGFDRANLYFDVIRMERKRKASWVASYIADHPDESGIVYCATRKEVESLAESLNIAVCELRATKGEDATRLGMVAVAYHAVCRPKRGNGHNVIS